VRQDEEDPQRPGKGQRGCLLGQHQESDGAESWQGMSQVKGVKDFIKVAGSATETGRYGEENLALAISAFVI
jgi:hypothetical protein